MRIIKFRSWDARTQQMGIPDGIANDIDGDRFQVMQYTGLKDKNGNEIYEGDYLKTDKGIICRVYWSKGGACFMVSYDNQWSTRLGKKIYKTLRQFHKRSEVVGNIYENSKHELPQ